MPTNPPGNHREREELRRDQQQLERLRQRRNQEIRQGDRREAREYNEKIRDRRGKFVKTGKIYMGTGTDGIVMGATVTDGIMAIIMSDF